MPGNKSTARKAMDELFNQRDITAVERYFADDYIQHNPMIADGRDGLIELLPTLPEDFRYTMLRAFEDGDHVIALARIGGYLPDGDAAVVDVFRFEDGRIAEHWDVVQAYVPDDRTVSGHPMLT
ncbi:SnoaL-like domain-containing protein [Actinoplanes sp. TBRC 11911]|uniref:nuclear transport factor 2 family protein n=1 Tax=Actinoplanes sp. TBRC 11911 TaxID=2729386 RepID=UPI00145E4DDB|nr:nuclear transport factor 2 family protein [Actinoplanes sp. TBRC 11911]NMO51483.1 SnoaL-like domain-containing protein [Actinoplanes sp. TBRC 11911]